MNQIQIKKLSTRYQVGEARIAQEYIQHCFLSELYKQEDSDKILFKGGTCLRLVFNSPRFSEDLDFTACQNISYPEIESLLTEVFLNLDNFGFDVEIKEAKKTTGGYISKVDLSFSGYVLELKIEISFRISRERVKKEISQIKNEFINTYDIYHLAREGVVSGKLAALMARSKPRDWYDLYFLIKNDYLNNKQKDLFPEILNKFENYKGDIKKELKIFLPKSHQIILKDFKKVLIQELKKYTA